MKKKLHIILDLDNTLIRAYYREQKTNVILNFHYLKKHFMFTNVHFLMIF